MTSLKVILKLRRSADFQLSLLLHVHGSPTGSLSILLFLELLVDDLTGILTCFRCYPKEEEDEEKISPHSGHVVDLLIGLVDMF